MASPLSAIVTGGVLGAAAFAALKWWSKYGASPDLRGHVLVPQGLVQGVPRHVWSGRVGGVWVLDYCASHGYEVGKPGPSYSNRWRYEQHAYTTDPGVPGILAPFAIGKNAVPLPNTGRASYVKGLGGKEYGVWYNTTPSPVQHHESKVSKGMPSFADDPLLYFTQELEGWIDAAGVQHSGSPMQMSAGGVVGDTPTMAVGGAVTGDPGLHIGISSVSPFGGRDPHEHPDTIFGPHLTIPAAAVGLCAAFPPAVEESQWHNSAWLWAWQQWQIRHPEKYVTNAATKLNYRTPNYVDLWSKIGAGVDKGMPWEHEGAGIITANRFPMTVEKGGMAYAYALSCGIAALNNYLECPDPLKHERDWLAQGGAGPAASGSQTLEQAAQYAPGTPTKDKVVRTLSPALKAWLSKGGGFGKGAAMAAGLGVAAVLGREGYRLLTGHYGPQGADDILLPSWEPVAVPLGMMTGEA